MKGFGLLVMMFAFGGLALADDQGIIELCMFDINPDDPPAPDFLNSFTAIFEINYDKGSGMMFNDSSLVEVSRSRHFGAVHARFEGYMFITIYDYFRNQTIRLYEKMDAGSYDCYVDKMDDMSEWATNTSTGKGGSPVVGSPEWIFRHNKKYKAVYLNDGVTRGIPVRRWRVCHYDDEGNTIAVTHEWGNSSVWHPVFILEKNTMFPVAITIHVQNKTDNKIYNQTLSFVSYDPGVELARGFEIPPGAYCANLNTEEVKSPKLYDFFSYSTEIIKRDGLITTIYYQKNYYDQKMGFSRTDVRLPLLGDWTLIEDVSRRLLFILSVDAEECVITKISNTSGLIQDLGGHKYKLVDPLAYIQRSNGELNFTYYEEGVDRAVKAQIFKALNGDMIQEWWYTMPIFEGVEENTEETEVPMKFVEYYRQDFHANRTQWNIFDFNYKEPALEKYDTTFCFKGTGRRHYMFSFDHRYDLLDQKNMTLLRYSVWTAIMVHAELAMLRITQLQLDGYDDMTVVIFTVLDAPPESSQMEVTIETAIMRLRNSLNAGYVKIRDYLNKEGKVVTLTGIPNSLNEIDRFEDRDWKLRGIVDESTHYSAGAMVGLGFGVIFLGLIIGGLASLLYFIRFAPN